MDAFSPPKKEKFTPLIYPLICIIINGVKIDVEQKRIFHFKILSHCMGNYEVLP